MASLGYRELVALLRQNGCEFVREGKGSHEWWFSPITKRHFSVPKTLKGEGTLHRILKDAGIRSGKSR